MQSQELNKLYYYQIKSGNNSKLIVQAIQKRQNWQEADKQQPNFVWNMSSKQFRFQTLSAKQIEIVNHLPNHKELTMKCNLIRNLKQYCKANHCYVWDITPLSIIVDFMGNSQTLDSSLKEFKSIYEQFHPKNIQKNTKIILDKDQFIRPKMHSTMLSDDDHYLWILKPNEYNCGRGIMIFRTIEELKDILLSFNKGNINSLNGKEKILSSQFVLQKYIQNPLLLDGRKFDIRIWVLVTHSFNIYIFKEGYARLSSELFDLDNLGAFVHLTNNAIQKYSQNYGQYEFGNQISYSKLDYYTNGNFTRTILPKIKSMIVFTWMTIQTMFQKCKYAFEIFGYDFMIDNQQRPWLIEINTNPCLDESSPLLQELLPKMIDDAFKIVIDSILTKKEEPTDWEHLLKL